MTSNDTHPVRVLLWSALLLAAPMMPSTVTAGETEGIRVRSVSVEGTGEGRRVTVELTKAPNGLKNFSLSSPPRVVVDLKGSLDGVGVAEARFPVEDDIVRRVRSAPYEGKLRVVLDLRRDVSLGEVVATDKGFTAFIGTPTLAAVPAPAVKPTAKPPVVAVTAPTTPATAPVVAKTKAAATKAKQVEAKATPAEAGTKSAEAKTAPQPRVAQAPTPDSLSPLIRSALGDSLDEKPRRVATAPRRVRPIAPPLPRIMAATAPAPGFKGQRISLDFKDADIQNVLRVLADVSGLNIIATDDVQGKVTLHLKDVPWDQAFDLILRTNQLESMRDGNVVRISSIERLTEEREALRLAKDAEREVEPLRVKYVRVNYARADEELIDKVRGVLTQRGSVTFDNRTNTVIVRDIERGISDASRLVSKLDVQSPQVLIEANIVEATEDFSRGLGVQWGYRFEAGPETGNPTGMNFPGTVGLGGSGLGLGSPPPGTGTGVSPSPVPFLADFPIPGSFGSGFGAGTGSALDLALGSLDGAHSLNVRLTALEELGKGRIVSRPRVITMNNVAATIQSLTILRVKLPSTGTVINTGAGGAAGGGSAATEKINTGITLVVTPQVSSDGYVLMSIFAKSSQPDFTRAVDGIPNEISREANSNVLVRSGETVVLGGIFRQTIGDAESGLPYLRDIPALGWLFKRQLKTDRKEELLVFLTPKILDTGTASLPPAERLWSARPQG